MGAHRFLVLAPVVFAGFACATEVPLEYFNKHPPYTAVRISPNGEYLAATAPVGDKDVLVVLSMADLKPIKVNQLPDEKSIGSFFWAGPDRLMFTASRKIGQFAQPVGTGEWYAVNADGSRPRVLVTYEGTTASGSMSYGQSVGPLAALREDSSKVLVQVSYSSESESGNRSAVMELDTFTGRMKRLASAPAPGCAFVLDADDKPAFANCIDNTQRDFNTEQHGQVYRYVEGEWAAVHDSRAHGDRLRVTHVDPDGTVYAVSHNNQTPEVFGTLQPATGAFTPIDTDARVDLMGEIIAADGKTLIGVSRMPGKPEARIVRKDHADAVLLEQLQAAFPGQYVSFSGATLDGGKLVVSVASDRNPGEFYLFDKSSGQASFLVATRKWIDPEQMAEMRPFTFKARDGVTLSGYLTIPKGRELSDLPMIVNPHGGPHGPRDLWGFNAETQLFANRGYLVLQVDFRGSGGYGRGFERMGYGEWGGTMQDDVTDATRWAIEQGYADENRICIYGASYGAYAALMGAAREPSLYQCTVGYVGVYDLALMYKEGDIRESDTGGNYLESVIGKDRSKLAERSPAARAADIRIPVFLAAGGRDRRTPPEQTEAMAAALEKAGNPARENILEPREGHGFYDVAARNNIYGKMLEFFADSLNSDPSTAETSRHLVPERDFRQGAHNLPHVSSSRLTDPR
jgi:dipeptidyl aminopeptidase/acylaminoacyl peptidase